MLDKLFRITSSLLLILLLSSCAKNFQVVADIPTPLIDPIALTAQLDYSDEFQAYKFVEKSDDRSLESVDFGIAQVSLFDSIFGSLFDISATGTDGHDLKIEPQILDFQYAEPKETKLKLYEVWVKYRLKVSDNKNEELADWVVKGYGKTPTSMLSSHLKAFNIACNVALRDVGAQLAIGFRNQPSIKAYLTAKLGGGGINSEGPQSEVQDSQLVEGAIESAEGPVESVEGSIQSAKGSSESSPKKAKDSVGAPDGSFDLELVSVVVSTSGEGNENNEVIDAAEEELR
ncbi:MAG: hypothetical protein ACI9XU_001409 [Arenicella sp.]|jgi:hypothetical protein